MTTEPKEPNPCKPVMEKLAEIMKQDPEYAWSWHCNIAMAFYDEGGDHKIANKAAARFLKNCFDVDTTAHRAYGPILNPIQDDSDLEGEEVIHNACGLEDGKCESCQ